MLIIERSPMGRQNHLMLPVLGLVTLRALLGMFVLFGDKVASLRKFKRGEPRDKKIKAGTFFPWILYEFQIEKYLASITASATCGPSAGDRSPQTPLAPAKTLHNFVP